MTDELKKVEEEIKLEGTEEKPEQPPEPSPAETEARKLGWKPEDEYEGEEGKWISAEEFVSRAPLYEKNRKLTKKLKEIESTVEHLKKHYSKTEEAAYQRALSTLKEEKIRALDDGDHKAVADIDDKILDLKKEPLREKQENKTTAEFDEWVSKNEWYKKDEDMRDYADAVGRRYARDNDNPDAEEVYRYAEQKVMERFPEKFRNPNRAKPSSVEGGSKSQPKSKRPSWSDLPEVYQTVGNKFVRNGVMTKEQYIDDLIKTGDIKGA